MQSGDGFVIVLIVLVLVVWGFGYARMKMRATLEEEAIPPDWIQEEDIPEDDTTRLLEDYGYKLLSGKKRLPVHVSVNNRETLQSRLFIDYIVEKGDQLFVVKLARDRKPLEITGSAIRERLLIYQVIVPDAAGVLYVDLNSGRIDCFEFEVLYLEQ